MSFPAGQVWRRPKDNLGYAEGVRGLGGIVAPLLAGFSLTAIAELVTSADLPPAGEWSILAFALAVGFLLHSMQVGFYALSADPSPATFLQWHPEALVDREKLEEVRVQQITKYGEMVRYWKTSNVAYDVGLNAFLAGLVLLLVPDDWTPARSAAFGVACVALFIELWWGVANRLGDDFPHPVFRRRATVGDVERLRDDLARSVMERGA
ncbi:MAG: hypothetical protein M3320_01400 [Actinomycetota bacterium]|nr:hypothetical protein [Actinomycetota bacterium]MDQ5807308.1 hypothetical protein [Actinomycetota bacterium]